MATRLSLLACSLLALSKAVSSSPLDTLGEIERKSPNIFGRQASSGQSATSAAAGSTNSTGRPGSSNANPDTVNCSDPSTGRANKCYAELGIADYLKDWVQTHECKTGESFANCYLRANGFGALDCSSISTASCPPPPLTDISDPQVYYTAYNIYAINAFFTKWYSSFGEASESAEDNIGEIVSLISSSANSTAQSKLSSQLGQLTRSTRTKINQTSVSVLSNYTEFNAFASQGNFSSSTAASPDITNYLYYLLNTFVVSSGLNGFSFYATVGKDTDVKALASNGTTLAYPINCASYDSNNQCDAFYYGKYTQSSYGLMNADKQQQDYTQLLSGILGTYTTGELLFESGQNCNTTGSINISINANGINSTCFSQLKALTWDTTCHADPSASGDADKSCEFLEQGKLGNFWATGKDNARLVPYTYLGPAIKQNKVKISRTG